MTVKGDNKESENEIWKIRLHGKCDGKDLKNLTDIAKISNTWVLGLPYDVKMKGHEYVQLVQVRGNSLATPQRRHRVRQSNQLCTRCGMGATAGLSHILQQCAATQLLRSSRHNQIYKFITAKLRHRGFHVKLEPKIPNPLRGQPEQLQHFQPDLIAFKPGNAEVFVLDPCRHLCQLKGEQVQKTKQDLYQNDAVHNYVINYAKEASRQEFILIKEKFEAGEEIWDLDGDPTSPYNVVVDAIAVNWRGGIWASTYDLLKRKLKISKLSLEIMVTRLLHFSWKIWHNYSADTRTIL